MSLTLMTKCCDSSDDGAGFFGPQGLEVELRSIQSHSLQSEGYLVQLDDRLSSLSTSTGRNMTGLSAEVSRASTWLHNQEVLLRYIFISQRNSSANEVKT